ncbi:hypothetical protein [Labilibaculum antarcticum]|uniref:Uncharacterized protein n=1 Tax=Labilibaculum antarcticum TaxID=1717717 RepID=A0A1Y1CN54_9BACT|nr:hypothetical protein [Labilibaculum antarcticum]BAX81827.1 hypothetical protein ALGA_3529 [Labilibaculum antarcticum]
MKRILVIFGFLLSISCSSQNRIQIDSISNEEIVDIFNRIELLREFKTEDLMIRLFSYANESGSAGFNSGEITNDIYFAVSEFDELPKQSLFKIKNLYSTEIVSIDEIKNDKVLITLVHIENKTKKTLELELTINELIKTSN